MEVERSIGSDIPDAASEVSTESSGRWQSGMGSECSETRVEEQDQEAPRRSDLESEDDQRSMGEAAEWAAGKIQEDAWNPLT